MSDDPNLFGVPPRRKKRQKAPPAAGGAVQRVIAVYAHLFRERFHEPPVITKADGAQLKRLITQFGAEKVESRVRAYLAWEDPFLRSTGYTLRMLHVKWNELTTRAIQQDVQAARDRAVVENTQEYLRKLREARRK